MNEASAGPAEPFPFAPAPGRTALVVIDRQRLTSDRGFECPLVSEARERYFADFKAALAMMTARSAIVGGATPRAALQEA